MITGKTIDEIIERYGRCNKPALTVVVPMETKERLGLGREYVLEAGDEVII